MKDSAVRLRAAAKHFGAVRAVDGIDLAITPGETVALLGPNGAGKSTAMALTPRRVDQGQTRDIPDTPMARLPLINAGRAGGWSGAAVEECLQVDGHSILVIAERDLVGD